MEMLVGRNMIKDNFWFHKNVLVTGASGFLGGYISEKLVNKDANVIALVRDTVPKSRLYYEKIKDHLTIVNGHLEDYFLLERIINEYEIEVVFHLAAQTIVTIANRSPLSTFESNIKGTWNILEACRNSELVNRIILASTDKAYGTKDKLPYYETDILNAKHPYDLSKATADLLAQGYAETYKLPVVITRCGNLYGGGDLNFNRIVPETIRSVLFEQNPIIRSDGTFLRDYFYVEDAADAYLILAENMLEIELIGEAFNFGTDLPVSVLDLVAKIIKISGKENLKPIIRNEVKGEIKNQYLSSEKAKRILKWQPRYTLEEGLTKTIEWYSKWFTNKSK